MQSNTGMVLWEKAYLLAKKNVQPQYTVYIYCIDIYFDCYNAQPKDTTAALSAVVKDQLKQ